jgi:hypothetical protein
VSPEVNRTQERIQFLTDVLITAVENYGYGWFSVDEYEPGGDEPDGKAYAAITDDFDDNKQHRIDLAVIAHGFGVITDAKPAVDPKHPNDGEVLHNAKTGQRLFVSGQNRKRLVEASRLNDAGELDVIDALAVVECGLFGAVTY